MTARGRVEEFGYRLTSGHWFTMTAPAAAGTKSSITLRSTIFPSLRQHRRSQHASLASMARWQAHPLVPALRRDVQRAGRT